MMEWTGDEGFWEHGGEPQERLSLQGSLYITVDTAVQTQDVTIQAHGAARALPTSLGLWLINLCNTMLKGLPPVRMSWNWTLSYILSISSRAGYCWNSHSHCQEKKEKKKVCFPPVCSLSQVMVNSQIMSDLNQLMSNITSELTNAQCSSEQINEQ